MLARNIYLKSYKGIICFVAKRFPLGGITHTSNICITISFASASKNEYQGFLLK